MTRRRPTKLQQQYQTRLDWLLVVQAGVSVLVGSVALAPDVPTYWIWFLGAVQASLIMAIQIVRKRALDLPDVPYDTDDTQPAQRFGAINKGDS